MKNEIMTFKNEVFGEVRTMCDEKGEPWFVGKDVAVALGYAKPRNAITAHIDEEDKTTASIQGTGSNYKTQAVIINESGLYSLIMASKLPQAKEFKRWVTSEVLPQIRKTGGYIPVEKEDDEKTILAKAVKILMKTVWSGKALLLAEAEGLPVPERDSPDTEVGRARTVRHDHHAGGDTSRYEGTLHHQGDRQGTAVLIHELNHEL